MNITFNSELALKFGGTEAAIIIQNLFFWINHNLEKGINHHDGKTWSYSSMKDLQQKYPFISFATIRNTLKRLLEAGIIVKGCYNKHKYDRTTWWAFKDEQVLNEISLLLNQQKSLPQPKKSIVQNNTPIPNSLKNINKQEEEAPTQTNAESSSKGKESSSNQIDSLLFEELTKRGLSAKQATTFLKTKEKEYILEKIRQYDYLMKFYPVKLDNPKVRYLIMSIKENWVSELYVTGKIKAEKEALKEKKKEAFEKQERMKKDYESYVETLTEQQINDLPEEIKEELTGQVKVELEANPFIRDNPNLKDQMFKAKLFTLVQRQVIIPGFEEFLKMQDQDKLFSPR